MNYRFNFFIVAALVLSSGCSFTKMAAEMARENAREGYAKQLAEDPASLPKFATYPDTILEEHPSDGPTPTGTACTWVKYNGYWQPKAFFKRGRVKPKYYQPTAAAIEKCYSADLQKLRYDTYRGVTWTWMRQLFEIGPIDEQDEWPKPTAADLVKRMMNMPYGPTLGAEFRSGALRQIFQSEQHLAQWYQWAMPALIPGFISLSDEYQDMYIKVIDDVQRMMNKYHRRQLREEAKYLRRLGRGKCEREYRLDVGMTTGICLQNGPSTDPTVLLNCELNPVHKTAVKRLKAADCMPYFDVYYPSSVEKHATRPIVAWMLERIWRDKMNPYHIRFWLHRLRSDLGMVRGMIRSTLGTEE